MAKIRLEFNAERVTIGDLIKMEDGFKTAREMRTMLLKFVVGENGQVIKGKQAIALLNKLTISEVLDAITKLSAIAKDEIIPPPLGGS